MLGFCMRRFFPALLLVAALSAAQSSPQPAAAQERSVRASNFIPLVSSWHEKVSGKAAEVTQDVVEEFTIHVDAQGKLVSYRLEQGDAALAPAAESAMRSISFHKLRAPQALTGPLALCFFSQGILKKRVLPCAVGEIENSARVPTLVRLPGVLPGLVPSSRGARAPTPDPEHSVQGMADVGVLIASDGSVKQTLPIAGGPRISESAGRAVSQFKFNSISFQGQPVEMYAEVTVQLAITK
jgi:hypothetical protein